MWRRHLPWPAYSGDFRIPFLPQWHPVFHSQASEWNFQLWGYLGRRRWSQPRGETPARHIKLPSWPTRRSESQFHFWQSRHDKPGGHREQYSQRAKVNSHWRLLHLYWWNCKASSPISEDEVKHEIIWQGEKASGWWTNTANNAAEIEQPEWQNRRRNNCLLPDFEHRRNATCSRGVCQNGQEVLPIEKRKHDADEKQRQETHIFGKFWSRQHI